MNEYGCIGKKLTHSFSKEIHALLADYEYNLIELTEEQVKSFLLNKNFNAVNVTIPYKQTVIPYLDFVSDIAKRIGAVNTIVNENGKLYGYNTDYYGLKALIKKIGLDLTDKKVLVLGTGGTSKTANVVAKDLGAKEVLTISRQKTETYVTYEEAVNLHSDAQVIINTTPCGMYPDIYSKPISISNFTNLEGVVDVVYNPLNTNLVLEAKEKGIKAEGGLYMLVMQAVVAVEKFLKIKIEKEKINRVYEKIYLSKENIVLTGMPGSGKSTIGKTLNINGYDFFDTDEEIEKRCGCTIKELMETKGEQYFRSLETEVIKEVSSKNCRIISTGGGAILKNENVKELKRNGKLFFINANLSRLTATGNRPLSNTQSKLEKLYNDRIGLYLSTADIVVPDMETAKEEANFIIENRKGRTEKIATFTPCTLQGSIDAPPSKSMAHRFLISSALSKKDCVLYGVDYSQDILATIDCLRSLGAKIETNGSELKVISKDFMQAKNLKLNCRESGSTLRFFIPLALSLGKEVTLYGSERLFERPLEIYEKLCKEKGFTFNKTKNSLTLLGNLKGGNYKINGNVSSQFITGLIFALVYLNEESTIEILPPLESKPYIDLTLSALKSFGAKVEFINDLTIKISPSKMTEFIGKIEGDYSNSAFLSAFNYLGSNIEVNNLDKNSLQGDKVYFEYFEKIALGTPTLDVSNCPDLAPILFALASLKNGATFTGTDRLKAKESDRGKAMAEELGKLGGKLIIGNNTITVLKKELSYNGEILYGHNDHRIVMALSVILSKIGGSIIGVDAISKSYPGFFEDIKKLSAKVKLL